MRINVGGYPPTYFKSTKGFSKKILIKLASPRLRFDYDFPICVKYELYLLSLDFEAAI